MYRYQHELLKNEGIYIAGPECFYTYGYDALAAMRKRAESLGFGVTLPNDDPLDLDNPDLRKRADSIFANLKKIMHDTTAVVADLEAYRGAEPDAGTVYELGMAYAKGARCYGYTRDKRSLRTKNQASRIDGTKILDERGKEMPYADLPFSPCIIGSTKIVEGDFDDCLRMLETDIEEEWKRRGLRGAADDAEAEACEDKEQTRPADCPKVYFADSLRYDDGSEERGKKLREAFSQAGFELILPMDPVERTRIDPQDNAYVRAAKMFDRYQQHVRDCDILLADLNDFRGYEVSTDVGFECGMAFQLGKQLHGFMADTRPMKERVPSFGAQREYRDQTGSNVEDFNYPLNLMFACSMLITEGDIEHALQSLKIRR